MPSGCHCRVCSSSCFATGTTQGRHDRLAPTSAVSELLGTAQCASASSSGRWQVGSETSWRPVAVGDSGQDQSPSQISKCCPLLQPLAHGHHPQGIGGRCLTVSGAGLDRLPRAAVMPVTAAKSLNSPESPSLHLCPLRDER